MQGENQRRKTKRMRINDTENTNVMVNEGTIQVPEKDTYFNSMPTAG